MKIRHLIISLSLLLIALTILSCSESARIAKVALKHEEAGSYRLAAEAYYESLQKDNNNEKAQKGLKRNAYKVLNDYVNKFNNHYDFGEYEKSYTAYQTVLEYKNKIEKFNIKLSIDNRFQNKYEKNKEILSEEYYKKGIANMNSADWKSAVDNFLKVKGYLPKYKDVNKKLTESHYNFGKELYNNKSYRKAYYQFDKCNSINPNFKKGKYYKNECLNLGKITIGVYCFRNRTSINNLDNRICSKISRELRNFDSPFIVVKSYCSSRYVTKNAIKNGRYRGKVDLALVGKIKESKHTSPLKKLKDTCYEIYYKKNDKGKKIKKGKKTYWYYHHQDRSISIRTYYDFVDTRSGKTVFNDNFSLTKRDKIEYGTYPGKKYWNLEPWDPKAKAGTVLLDGYRRLKSPNDENYVPLIETDYFKSRKKLRSYKSLVYNFPSSIAEEISEEIRPKIINF